MANPNTWVGVGQPPQSEEDYLTSIGIPTKGHTPGAKTNAPGMLDSIVTWGKHLLDTGQVSPEEAVKNAKAVGLKVPPIPKKKAIAPKPSPSPSPPPSISMTPPASKTSLSMAEATPAEMQAAALMDAHQPLSAIPALFGGLGVAGGQKGTNAKLTDEFTKNDGIKTVVTSNRFNDPEEMRLQTLRAMGDKIPYVKDAEGNIQFQPMLDARGQPYKLKGPDGAWSQALDYGRPLYDLDHSEPDPSSPYRQQEKGVDDLQSLLQMQAKANTGRSTMDFSPLAHLADVWAKQAGLPGGYADGMKPPEDQNPKLIAFAEEVQKRRGELQKGLQDTVKLGKGGGTFLEQLMNAQALKESASAGYGQGGAGKSAALGDVPTWYTSLMQQVKTSTKGIGGKQVLASNAMLTALSQMSKLAQVPESIIKESTQTQRNAIASLLSTSRSAENERQVATLSSLWKDLGQRVSHLMNTVGNVPQDDPQLVQIKAELERNYMSILAEHQKLVTAAAAGYGPILDLPGNELLKSGYIQAVDAQNSLLTPEAVKEAQTRPVHLKQGGGGGKKLPPRSQITSEQRDAYLKAHMKK